MKDQKKEIKNPRVKRRLKLMYSAKRFTNGGMLNTTHPSLKDFNLLYKGKLQRNVPQPWHFNQNGIVILHNPHQHTVRGPNVSLTRVPNNYEQCRATNQRRGSHKRQRMFNETYRIAKQHRGKETDPILNSIRTMIPSDHVMIMPLDMFHRGPVRAAANELSAYKIKTHSHDRQYRAICNVFSKTDLSASIKGRPKSIPLCIFASP